MVVSGVYLHEDEDEDDSGDDGDGENEYQNEGELISSKRVRAWCLVKLVLNSGVSRFF